MKSPALEEISMYHRQQGITAIGFIILAAFIGLFILAGVKLAPIYLEGMDVKSALTKAKTELDGNRPSIVNIRIRFSAVSTWTACDGFRPRT